MSTKLKFYNDDVLITVGDNNNAKHYYSSGKVEYIWMYTYIYYYAALNTEYSLIRWMSLTMFNNHPTIYISIYLYIHLQMLTITIEQQYTWLDKESGAFFGLLDDWLDALF